MHNSHGYNVVNIEYYNLSKTRIVLKHPKVNIVLICGTL